MMNIADRIYENNIETQGPFPNTTISAAISEMNVNALLVNNHKLEHHNVLVFDDFVARYI